MNALRDSIRGSASLTAKLVDELFGSTSDNDMQHGEVCVVHNASDSTAPPRRIIVCNPESRRDAGGNKYQSHALLVQLMDGVEVRTERRYTDFVALHEEVHVALALPSTFPIMAVPQALQWFGTPREEKLQQYCDKLLDGGARKQPLPTLTAFCRAAPYVATGSPVAACLSALATVAPPGPSVPSQCLAMLRAHVTSSSSELHAAGARRLLELVRNGGPDASSWLVDAGAIEFLCAALRRRSASISALPSSAVATQITSSPSTLQLPVEKKASPTLPSFASLTGRSSSSSGGGGGEGGVMSGGGSGSGCGGCGHVVAAGGGGGGVSGSVLAASSLPFTAASAAEDQQHQREFASDAVGVLAALAAAPNVRTNARWLLRRCGIAELLTGLMKLWPDDVGLQSGCAALIAALVAADHTSPPGLASHYEFEAVACSCQAMTLHRSKLDVQWHGCAALHALAGRAPALAESVCRHHGVRLICKAMSTYRTDAAARLQASACAALAALADQVPSSRETLQSFSAGPLVTQTLADFLAPTDGGAAVFVCGARALLTMSELPPAAEPLLPPDGGVSRLEELAFTAAQLHASRFVVKGVVCEIIVAVAWERLKLAAAGTLDLPRLVHSGSAARAARFVAATLAQHGTTTAGPAPAEGASGAGSADALVVCAALTAAKGLAQLQHVAVSAALDQAVEVALPPLLSATDVQSLAAQVQRTAAARGASHADDAGPMPSSNPHAAAVVFSLASAALAEFDKLGGAGSRRK